jgi:molybdopterin-guanine dinucleotide biosynthesis protein A
MPAPKISVSILAGGLSSRMGRDKARVRLGQRTLLAHARRATKELSLPVRVIRRDLVPRCGPLGGVFTALKTSRADAELFLACDMPFVSVALLKRLLRALRNRRAVFTVVDGTAGFPFALRVDCLPVVERQLAAKEFSLQSLAKSLRATRISPPRGRTDETLNINTASELATARAIKGRRKTVPGLNSSVRV